MSTKITIKSDALCDGGNLFQKYPCHVIPPLQIELLINDQDLRASVIASDHVETTCQFISNASISL